MPLSSISNIENEDCTLHSDKSKYYFKVTFHGGKQSPWLLRAYTEVCIYNYGVITEKHITCRDNYAFYTLYSNNALIGSLQLVKAFRQTIVQIHPQVKPLFVKKIFQFSISRQFLALELSKEIIL